MKKTLYILLICALVVTIVSVYKLNSSNNSSAAQDAKAVESLEQDIKVDESLPQNITFINSSESVNFVYEMNVKLDEKRDETGFNRVWYLLRITKKNQDIYNNLKVTGFIDESMRDLIMAQIFLGFGTDIEDKINIGKDSKGMETGRVTYISDSLGLEEIKERLKKEIKVKVVWDGGAEYVIIPTAEINLEVIN